MTPMISIGQQNTLTVSRIVPFGMYLDAGEAGDILIPNKYIPANTEVGQELTVFIYLDSEDRLIATTLKPRASVGEFAWLKVVSMNQIGAFADWGLEKDLFIPFREQDPALKLQEGKSYLFRIYLDEQSGRIAASQRHRKFLSKADPDLIETGQSMEVLVFEKSPIGWKVIVENQYAGILYANEVFQQRMEPGVRINAFVKKVREDGKLDLVLQEPGYGAVTDFSDTLLKELVSSGGFIALTDKSSPDLIYERFGVSKKIYKKAVGALYKARKISIEKDGIQLN